MWYAIRTGKGQEELAKAQAGILRPGAVPGRFRELYCVRKKRYLGQWHEERDRFLPGYLFFITEGSSQGGGRETPDGMPGFGEERDALDGLGGGTLRPVSQEEEEFLRKLMGGKEEIGMSYGVIRDGVLKISRGALVGMESRVRKIDRHKRKGYISMSLDGKEEVAEIGLEITEKTCGEQPGLSLSGEMPPGNQSQGVPPKKGVACGM